MKGWVFWVCFLLALEVPRCAWGDGCVIPATAFARMEIPDQRALIHFADGKETLVIDTAFKGEGTNFAWIVPVPSKPEVEAASPGLFTTLQFVFQPVVNHAIWRYYKASLFCGFWGFVLIWKLRRGATLGRAVFVTLLWFCLVVFLAGLFLPAFATAGSNASPVGSVAVIARNQVGVYDTATLKSADGTALIEWLDHNGFSTPTNYLPVIRDYAREGWYFIASKIRIDATTNEAVKPHPLSFTFNTPKAVYPLRLTGINNPHCKIELYVFGTNRAEATNFTVERCELPSYFTQNDERAAYANKTDTLILGHPTLLKLVDASPVATKLTGDLSSSQMEADAYVDWTGFQPKQRLLYSYPGAKIVAENLAITVLVAAALLLYAARNVVYPWADKARMIGRVLILTGILGGVLVYFALPKTEVTVKTMPGSYTRYLHRSIGAAIEDIWEKATNRPAEPTADWVRTQINSPLKVTFAPWGGLTNYFLGQPMREEDSPGNYTLRETTIGVEYVWYDVNGAEHPVQLFQERKAGTGR